MRDAPVRARTTKQTSVGVVTRKVGFDAYPHGT